MKIPAPGRIGLTLLAESVFILIASGAAISQETNGDLVSDDLVSDDLVGHTYYREMRIQNDDPPVGGGDYEIDIFGLDVQKSLRPGTLLYGYETGAVVSLNSEVGRFRAASGSEGGTVAVSVDINHILTKTTLRLNDSSGDVDLEGWQYYVGLAFRF